MTLLTSKSRKWLIYINDDDLLEKYSKVWNFLVKFETTNILEIAKDILKMNDFS